MFVAIGAVDDAVTAFSSIREVDAAIDACARMNHWKPDLKRAGKGRDLLQTLIDNGKRTAGLFVDTAKLLLKDGTLFLQRCTMFLQVSS